MARRRVRGENQNLSSRLQERIEQGDYYEALQLYKTSFARLCAQGKHSEAYELISDGAAALAKRKERNAATELGLLLIDTLEERAEKDSAFNIEEVSYTDTGVQQSAFSKSEALPLLFRIADSFTACSEQIIFLKRAVKFSGDSTDDIGGAIRLKLAQSYEEMGDFGRAARQYSTTNEVEMYANMLKKWASKGYKTEKELFFCRATLHMLSIGRFNEAKALWMAVSENVPASSSIGQFIRILLVLVENRPIPSNEEGVQAFSMVNDHYEKALVRDPEIVQMVTRIGERFFGLKSASHGGLLGSLMQMFG